MSLVNRMLQDLDQRNASAAERNGLPSDARPLPARNGFQMSGRPTIYLLGVAILAAAISGAYWWQRQQLAAQPVPVPVAIAPAPVVSPAPEPSPVAVVPPPAVSTPVVAAAALPTMTVANTVPVRPVPAARPEPSGTKPTGAVSGFRLDRSLPRADSGATNAVAGAVSETGETPLVQKRARSLTPREQADDDVRKGNALLAQGKATEATALLERALQTDPTHVAARQGLLRMLIDARRFDAAEKSLREGLSLQPTNAGWAVGLARLQVELGNIDAARETLASNIRSGASSADVRALAGALAFRQGKSIEAIEHYTVALKVSGSEPRWWVGLASALEAEGRAGEAREAYQRARSLGNLTPDLLQIVEQKLR